MEPDEKDSGNLPSCAMSCQQRERAVAECARPRAQQSPSMLKRLISLHLRRFPTLLRPGTGALVRLRGQWDRAVKVRFCAVKSCAVSNRNCIAAMRGGEQRNENDQSVTQVVPEDSRGELDSVGVDGRVF